VDSYVGLFEPTVTTTSDYGVAGGWFQIITPVRTPIPTGPGVGRGWHDADPLPPPMLMPDLCPSLKGSGLTLGDVSQAIYEVHAILKAAGPDYDGEDVRRAMILNRLEARLHEARPEAPGL